MLYSRLIRDKPTLSHLVDLAALDHVAAVYGLELEVSGHLQESQNPQTSFEQCSVWQELSSVILYGPQYPKHENILLAVEMRENMCIYL